MACQHGCLYCDGRAERYYIEGKFDKDIVIRSNLPEALRQELGKIREKGVISIGSGVSDAYQPVEAEEELMRKSAEILNEFSVPAIVLTKSDLILRDLDLWAALNKKAGFMLVVSLVFHDDQKRRIFEPKASSVENRLRILSEFKKKGCSTGVLAMPFMPFIADSTEDIRTLYGLLEKCNVDFIMPGALTLRPGRQKDVFFRLIRNRYPDLLERIRFIFAEERPSGVPVQGYLDEVNGRFSKVRQSADVPFLVPHSFFREKTQRYDEINILLHHMVELYRDRKIDVKPLEGAVHKYMGWLNERKKVYNRHSSWRYADLDGELIELIENGELTSLIGNERLSDFVRDIVIHRKIFDYISLKSTE